MEEPKQTQRQQTTIFGGERIRQQPMFCRPSYGCFYLSLTGYALDIPGFGK